MLFVGTTDYQLDDRKRVPIPPAFRAAFAAGGYLNAGIDPCVVLYTEESLETAAAEIEAFAATTTDGENARRDFYGRTEPTQKDAQGRIGLTEVLLKHAGIVRDVTVVGMRDKLEIWDRATFAAGEPERRAARVRAQERAMERLTPTKPGGA